MSLCELADAAYQERNWSGKGPGECYDYQLIQSLRFIDGYGCIEVATEKDDIQILYQSGIGIYFRTESECNMVFVFANMLNKLIEECEREDNDCYRNSHYLPKMRAAALSTILEMLKSDKEDVELLEYMKQYMKENGIVLSKVSNLIDQYLAAAILIA